MGAAIGGLVFGPIGAVVGKCVWVVCVCGSIVKTVPVLNHLALVPLPGGNNKVPRALQQWALVCCLEWSVGHGLLKRYPKSKTRTHS